MSVRARQHRQPNRHNVPIVAANPIKVVPARALALSAPHAPPPPPPPHQNVSVRMDASPGGICGATSVSGGDSDDGRTRYLEGLFAARRQPAPCNVAHGVRLRRALARAQHNAAADVRARRQGR